MTRLYLAPSTRTSFFQVRNSHRTNLSGSHLGEPLKPGRPKRPDIHSPHALAARVWAHDFNLDNRILPGPLILQWRREKSHWALAAVTSEPMGRRGSGLVAADSHAVLATAGVSPASCSVQQWLSSVPTDHRQLEGLVFGSCYFSVYRAPSTCSILPNGLWEPTENSRAILTLQTTSSFHRQGNRN